MNVGTDYSLSYFDGNTGTIQDLGDVQSVKIVALKHELKSMPYNDVPRYGYVPDGFRIDFSIVRTASLMEDLMVTFSKNFNQGAVIKPGYLNESIHNPDGSISRYQYTNFVIFLDDHGDVSREKPVMLRLSGMASDKKAIA
jgi:hypothetical protein